jgi:hypothetical protein
LPTVPTKSVLITSVVEVFEERIVGVYDIPGAFLYAKQTDLVYIKMTGELTAFIMEVSPDKYSEYVILGKGKETIYLRLEKAFKVCIIVLEGSVGKPAKTRVHLKPL